MNINITLDGTKSYSLNLQTGIYQEFTYNTTSGVNLTVYKYASMADKHFLVTEITMESASGVNSDVSVAVIMNSSTNTSDMNVQNDVDNTTQSYHIFQAVPAIVETDNVSTPNLTIFSTNIPTNNTLTLPKGQKFQKWVFYSVITMNNYSLAQDLFNKGKDLAKTDANGISGFMSSHVAAWYNIWQSRVDIEGNCELATKIHATYYYILSSMPISTSYEDDGWPFFGISPGSLANDDQYNYHGHVFWDQDLWMLIGLVPLYPEVVKRALQDSRVRHLEPAKLNAKRFGWDGAMFPWELAYSGYECDPWPPSALYEIHVTGDSALSALTYLRLAGDADFAQKFYNTSLEIAKYYYSLLHPVPQTNNQSLGIYNVMGPDEYHYPINNSVYMNSIAKIALNLPSYIYNNFNVTGDKPSSTWVDAAKNVYILFDSKNNYHPQYEGYQFGEQIKQADVILLGYPLLVEMDPQVRKNDLLIYQASTDALGGPAMTWAMHSVGWLEFGEEAFAAGQFRRNYNYMRAPFYVWTETATGVGTVNFVTGMGGFMQNLLQGYLGLRIHENRLEFTPYLLPDTTKYTAHGVNYQGMTFSFAVDNSIVQVNLISTPKSGCVFIDENGNQRPLNQSGIVFNGTIKAKRMISCQPNTITKNPTTTPGSTTPTPTTLNLFLFYIVMLLLWF
uniref:Protein-glucosylgalactosylhydroxylysine glucosidase n=1 Tax=Acrobeloides nanus TaxID=290746 RepID=A0A914DPS5_9BILA